MVCAPVRRFSEGIIDRTGAQTMLYLTCTMICSVDLAHYGVSRPKDWESVDCGTKNNAELQLFNDNLSLCPLQTKDILSSLVSLVFTNSITG